MSYVVELAFDEALDTAIRGLWEELARLEISKSPADHGCRPHLSISSCGSLEISRFQHELTELVKVTRQLPVSFESVSAFLSPEGVVFLAPVVTVELLRLQSSLIGIMQDCDAEIPAVYLPEHWVPHCTLATNLSAQGLANAIAHCQKNYSPLSGYVEQIGLVEVSAENVGGCYSLDLLPV